MAFRSNLLRAALAIGISLGSLANGRTITLSDARKLVREALAASDSNGPSVKIERFRYNYAPEFYVFMAWWPNPAGSPLLGYYAVNPWTGDVWDVMGCKRISSPAIEKEKESIRRRSKLAAEVEGTLHEKSPGCSAIERKTTAGKPEN
jgi:hypothetical protein